MEETRNVWENEELLNIVTVGHVDHGKSTVIGRLLADAGALPKGKLESIRENCRRNSKPFEYAFLLDALHNEQDQGITIDTARCFFKSDKRRYIIIDAPGHIEFLKNMVTGASRAEAALMVIDAARGVEENTRRHGYFLSMLGIRQVAVLVNKMDLVGYSEEVYRSIVTEFTEFLAKINISPAAFIPVSGMEGDNIAIRSERTPWYFGPTVLEQMDAFVPVPSPENRPLRMPVQGVYKFTEGGDERRIVAGTLEAGSLRAGDKIVFYPSGKKTTVASLEVFSAPTPEKFIAGDAAAVEKAGELALQAGAKRVVPLKVSGPFHTSLMAPAGEALVEKFRSVAFGEMSFPVLFNCKGGPMEAGETIPELLVRQVQSSVYLEDTIRAMAGMGVDTIVEIGPGKALSAFVKKTEKGIKTYAVETVEDIEKLCEALKGEQA